MQVSFRSKVNILVSLLVVSSACLALLFSVKSEAHAASPHISLSPNHTHPSASVKVSGKGFQVSETISITFDSISVGTATTDSTGTFATKIIIPSSALPGTHTIQATGSISGLTASASFLVQTDWAMFGFNASNRRFNPYENVLSTTNVSSMVLDWSYTTGGGIPSSPAIVNGVVYVGSQDDNLYAFNATTGAKLWSYSTGGFIQSSSAVANGIVYVGSNDGHLYAINASTGATVWNYRDVNGSPLVSSPVVLNNSVYIGFADGNVYAFKAATGVVLWHYTTVGALESSAAVVNGVVYVGSGITLYAINATIGTKLWSYTTGGQINSTPAVVNGVVYFGSSDNNLYAIKASTGTKLWSYTTSNSIDSSPAVANGIVYFTNNDNAYALNTKTGVLLWNSTGVSAYSSLTVANGIVYSGAYTGVAPNVYALNATTGAILWSYTTGNAIESSPAVVNGVVYIGSFDNKLYAFHLPGTTP